MSLRRTMLFVTAGALAAGGVLSAAPAANAESASLSYACTAVTGPVTMSVVTDTDLPAVMHVGQSLPVGLTSDVTIPADFESLLYKTVGVRTAEGTATAEGVISGPSGTTPTSTDLTVPQVSLPDPDNLPAGSDGSLLVHSTGTGAPFAPTVPGVYTISAGAFSSSLTLLDENGDTPGLLGLVGGNPQVVPCTAPTDVSTTVDTVTVKWATTTTLALSRSRAAYHQGVTATASVSSAGGAATGSVTFTVAGHTYTAPVRSGKATLTLPVLHAGSQRVTARYNGAGDFDASNTATRTLSVTKATTRTSAALKSARLHKRPTTKVTVRSAAGTPTGRVTILLKKGAHTVVRKVVSLTHGAKSVKLAKLTKKGNYTLTVTYSGTHDLAGSKVVKHFRVRR